MAFGHSGCLTMKELERAAKRINVGDRTEMGTFGPKESLDCRHYTYWKKFHRSNPLLSTSVPGNSRLATPTSLVSLAGQKSRQAAPFDDP